VVPAHLNELSPPQARGAFPGFAYQLGNLFAAYNATLQDKIAESRHDNYALALALVCGVVAVVLALVTWFGPEAKGVAFAAEATGDA
jgi:SHS family lactate transporter-like MFS transporter